MTEPLFDSNASKTLEQVAATFGQRGAEYGDTWRNCQWLALRSVASALGIDITADEARKIGAAALYDVKYQRLEGGYKEDSIIDGIAYGANLVQEMKPQQPNENIRPIRDSQV